MVIDKKVDNGILCFVLRNFFFFVSYIIFYFSLVSRDWELLNVKRLIFFLIILLSIL